MVYLCIKVCGKEVAGLSRAGMIYNEPDKVVAEFLSFNEICWSKFKEISFVFMIWLLYWLCV